MTPVTLEAIRSKLDTRPAPRITDGEAAQAAVALILAPAKTGEFHVLFIRRALVAGDPWSGHMALPGGRRHVEDTDLRATAIRETHEETGILLTPETYLGDLDEFTPRVQHLPRIIVRPHVFGLPKRPALSLSEEVASFRWASLAELRASRRTVDVEVRGTVMPLPAFVIGNDVIWGLTERIVSPLMQLLDEIS